MIRRAIDLYRQAYKGLPREAWILFAVHLVNSAGTMVIFFLTLYLTRQRGFTLAQAGQALSAFGLGSLAGSYLGGWISDRIGSTNVQKIGLVLSGVFYLALSAARTPAAVFGLIFILALSFGSLHPANATSMARVCPPEILTKGFALNRLANNIGATIGPAVGGFLALIDYRLLFWVDGLTCLAAALVFTLIWKHPEQELRAKTKDQTAGSGSPWRDVPFLLLLVFIVVWCMLFIQLLTTFPIYMRNIYAFAENRIGQLFMINTSLIIAFEMILMDAIKKYPLTRFIGISFVLTGTGLALLPLGRGFLFAALAMAVLTFGEMLSMPLMGTLIAGRAGPESRGRYLGLFSFAFSLAMILAPAAGTGIYDRFGPSALWFGCGAVGILLFAAFALLKRSLTPKAAGVSVQSTIS